MDTSATGLREMFEAALALPDAEREAFIGEHCEDPVLRERLMAMLAADASEGDGIPDTSADALARAIDHDDAPDLVNTGDLVGRRIGDFRLLRLLGKGGMAAVFLAERAGGDFEQRVAVKLLRRGLYSQLEQRLFLRERRLLASLNHPNIAHVIDGGVGDDGVPYLVMEFVDGMPITRYAAAHQLDIRQRLELFLDACHAVQAAHNALIVHRDIKPTNILVTSDGTLKLLDFGIAKLLDEDEDGATRGVFTPEYAAPEQRAGGAISTATDVYALGALLHELLLGLRPHLDRVRRPSSRINELSPEETPAPGRSTPPGRLRKVLRGDIDNILLKALAPEPQRRYASASALAEDIERHLRGRTVAAHPPSSWYRTRKFVARHRGALATSATFVLAILAALGIALWQANIAREQAARANMVRDFVESLFAPIRYGTAKSRQPSLSELLDRGVERLDHSPQLNADERVDLMSMFSRLYENLGNIPRSRALAGEAVTLSERTLRPTDINAIRALTARGYAAVRDEDYAAGGADLRVAHRRMLAQHIHGEDLIDLLEPLGAMENIEGHGDAALALNREALAERIATWGPDDPRVGVGYNDLASALEGMEHYDESIRMWQRTYRFELAHFGRYSNETTLALSGWASAEYRAGYWAAANDRFTRALAMYARIGGRPQVTRVYAAQKACMLAGLRADRAGALARCGEARELSATGFGADSPLHGDSLEATAFGDIELGHLRSAHALFEQARRLYGDAPANRMRRGRVDSELAGMALLESDPQTARRLLPDAITRLRTRAYRMPPLIAEARLLLACAQAPGPPCPSDLQATVQRHLAAVATRRDPRLLWVHTLLARVELRHGKPEQARARLSAAIERASLELAPSHPRRLSAQMWLAVAEARLGQCRDALKQATATERLIHTQHLDAHPLLVAARDALTSTARQPGRCGALMADIAITQP